MRICNSKTFNPLPSTGFLGECHQPTEQNLIENLTGPGESLGWVSGRKTHFFCFLMSFRQLNGLQWHQKLYSWLKNLKSYASSKPACFFWIIIRLMAEYNIT